MHVGHIQIVVGQWVNRCDSLSTLYGNDIWGPYYIRSKNVQREATVITRLTGLIHQTPSLQDSYI